ncbi:MAG: 3-oxoacyl-ACP reductase FabG [Anaerolineales bacterium]|nr:3-oxoacyl-ACP reductase FabG [Anaerolineales bacterium]MCB8952769.1 3-oxoacyl-ACP reductase FabG [Ardenticatenales bacterium]
MKFQGKVCLVTGGAAGIGRATAAKFLAEGASVVICDVNEAAGQAAAAALGAGARFDVVNVADSAAVQAWVADVAAAYGRIDVLVNNAGITRDAQLIKYKNGAVVDQMSAAAWDAVINVNLKGVFNCTQAVVPIMIAQGGGVILNASSVVGLYGNFGQTNYVATKAGVIGMTKVWARELGKYHIRVNAVAPGFIGTEMVQAMPEKVLAVMREHTPIGRLGEPVDIANAYAFLASDEASFITGAVLSVDGGIVIGT